MKLRMLSLVTVARLLAACAPAIPAGAPAAGTDAAGATTDTAGTAAAPAGDTIKIGGGFALTGDESVLDLPSVPILFTIHLRRLAVSVDRVPTASGSEDASDRQWVQFEALLAAGAAAQSCHSRPAPVPVKSYHGGQFAAVAADAVVVLGGCGVAAAAACGRGAGMLRGHAGDPARGG